MVPGLGLVWLYFFSTYLRLCLLLLFSLRQLIFILSSLSFLLIHILGEGWLYLSACLYLRKRITACTMFWTIECVPYFIVFALVRYYNFRLSFKCMVLMSIISSFRESLTLVFCFGVIYLVQPTFTGHLLCTRQSPGNTNWSLFVFQFVKTYLYFNCCFLNRHV